MRNRIILALCFLCFACQLSWSQEDTEKKDAKEKTKEESVLKVMDTVNANAEKKVIDPLSPSRAAFYSAVLPGLGQAYNKKYWKIPIVYAALGTGIYFYIDNNNKYNRYRRAYKQRLAGIKDEFSLVVTDANALIDAQEFYQRNRDLSLLLTVIAYVLNIVDANVDAHLLQFNVSDDLSLRPHIDQNEIDFNRNLGLTLNFKF